MCTYTEIPAERLEYGGSGISSLLDYKPTKNFWEVQTTTIQQFIQSFSITDCNFIKIDIEGAEFDLIPSMSNYLKNQKPTLFIEIHLWTLKDPMKKLYRMFQTLDGYDHIYDAEKISKEVDIDYFTNIARSRNVIRVLLTDIAIPHF